MRDYFARLSQLFFSLSEFISLENFQKRRERCGKGLVASIVSAFLVSPDEARKSAGGRSPLPLKLLKTFCFFESFQFFESFEFSLSLFLSFERTEQKRENRMIEREREREREEEKRRRIDLEEEEREKERERREEREEREEKRESAGGHGDCCDRWE